MGRKKKRQKEFSRGLVKVWPQRWIYLDFISFYKKIIFFFFLVPLSHTDPSINSSMAGISSLL